MQNTTSIRNLLPLGATVLAALTVAPPAASDTNLIRNGDFQGGLTGWSRSNQISWSPSGASSPGAARIHIGPEEPDADVLVQCIDLEGGRLYDLAASALLPYSDGASGGISARLQFRGEAGCQGALLRGSTSLDLSFRSPVAWQTKELRLIPAPFEAKSAMLAIVARGEGRDEYALSLDDLSLRPSQDAEVLTIPTVVSASGALGQKFQTDLFVHNPVPAERRFSLRLQCSAAERCPTTFVVLTVGARSTAFLPDVLGDLFRRHSTGALEVVYDPRGGPFSATSRVTTTNPSSPGNGTVIPALPREAARTRAIYLGLAGAGEPEATFRVNAGAYNPSDAPVTVMFRLYDPSGAELGSLQRTLGARERHQVNDVPSAMGVSTPLDPGAQLVVESFRPFFPFVLVLDNRTGDATFAPPVDLPETF